jgi:hypothetical protein
MFIHEYCLNMREICKINLSLEWGWLLHELEAWAWNLKFNMILIHLHGWIFLLPQTLLSTLNIVNCKMNLFIESSIKCFRIALIEEVCGGSNPSIHTNWNNQTIKFQRKMNRLPTKVGLFLYKLLRPGYCWSLHFWLVTFVSWLSCFLSRILLFGGIYDVSRHKYNTIFHSWTKLETWHQDI